jgi:hypothetical protein
MSNSTYVSLNPVYSTSGPAVRSNSNTSGMSKLNPAPDAALKTGNLRAIPATDQNPIQPKTKQSVGTVNIFKNDIYDNVKIDTPSPDDDTPEFCRIGDENAAEKEMSDENAPSAPATKDLKGEALDFFNSITQTQWLWAGGITAGFLMLRKNNK